MRRANEDDHSSYALQGDPYLLQGGWLATVNEGGAHWIIPDETFPST